MSAKLVAKKLRLNRALVERRHPFCTCLYSLTEALLQTTAVVPTKGETTYVEVVSSAFFLCVVIISLRNAINHILFAKIKSYIQ